MGKKAGDKHARVPPPYALAMVICDAIWRDPGTGKRTILGCFAALLARQFPAVHPIMAVYAALTDGRGKVTIKVQIVDAESDNQPIAEMEGEVDFPDPRAIMEMDLHFTNVSFPTPGEFRIQLFANEEFILERRLLVARLPEKKGQ